VFPVEGSANSERVAKERQAFHGTVSFAIYNITKVRPAFALFFEKISLRWEHGFLRIAILLPFHSAAEGHEVA